MQEICLSQCTPQYNHIRYFMRIPLVIIAAK